MKIIGIIPARYASTRFPGKPLADIHGKSMIQRVYEQAIKATSLDAVYIATDDDRIFSHAKSFTDNVMMTRPEHQNGTERCAEAAGLVGDKADAIINIQGDEPYIHPEQIDQVAEILKNSPSSIATLIKKLDTALVTNPNTVKAVISKSLSALYFSRSPIPFDRNNTQPQYYKHIGIYGFPVNILQEIVQLPASTLELAESLEQLRWLENGYLIQTANTKYESQAVDVPEDIIKLKVTG